MADDGGSELPKPPRRVPGGGAEQPWRTAIQARPPAAPPPLATPPATVSVPVPARRVGRIGVLLVVVVLAVGVGAGWLVREQSRTLDPELVLQETGPAVVRVLATTCAGTGQATGVRLGDGLVLTAASAIRRPVSVGLETPGGQVRRATVVGIGGGGVAVLRVIGSLDGSPAGLAPEEPHPKADRAVLGYTAEGDQSIDPAGTAESARPLRDVIGEASLGAPVLDPDGQVVGLVVGETVRTGRVVGLPELRPYLGSRPPVAPEQQGTCQARGPQTPLVPTLAVANTPIAGEVLQTLSTYLNGLNRHDFAAMQTTYSKHLAGIIDIEADTAQHKTSYAFGATITEATPSGNTGAIARLRFTVLFSADGLSARGLTCSRLDIRYVLVRQDGRLKINEAHAMPGDRSCDTD